MQSFEIECEEDGGERRWIRVSVGEACTLSELHNWLTGAFELSPRGSFSFTLAGRRESDEASFRGVKCWLQNHLHTRVRHCLCSR